MKRFYECTYIVNPGLDDAQIESTANMIEDTIVKNGGEIVSTEHIGRKRLAYPIAKKHNGYYVSVEFRAEGRLIERVERFMTLDENIMRYLTIQLDDRELEAKRARAVFLQQQKEIENGGVRPEPAESATVETTVEAPAEDTVEEQPEKTTAD